MIKEINNKGEWENFLEKCGRKSFLNSWEWGEFQVGQGFKILRLGAVDNSRLIALALAVKIKAKRGTYILIQHGPNIIETNPVAIQKILDELFLWLKEWAKKEGASFIRCAPLLERNEQNLEIFKNLGLREAPMHANAYEATWKLDIGQPEDDLLKGMRKTTRYLIRQAQKNPDISVEKSALGKEIEIYGGLNEELARRQKFVAFKKDYIEREFNAFAKDGQALWFIGRYKGEPAAASLVVFWSGIAFYHQAASRMKFAKYSIPYLLQWEAIKEAKARGCAIYDFWGYTDPKAFPKHPWAGPTLFKMGFGGRAHEYVKTMDLPLSWKYWPVYIFESLRKLKRGL
ncbi:MAG: peptidoglycan bridge formation glycyltransferase FemA/FemB family protein [Minisyncoccales bacterium]